MWYAIFFGIVSTIGFLVVGCDIGNQNQKGSVGGTSLSFFIAVFALGLTLYISYNTGLKPLKELDASTTYLLQARTVAPNGKSLFLLYDLKEKENRMAYLETYPPKGHQEISANDGGKLLVPALFPALSVTKVAKDCGTGPC